jgi:hypothetical protein
VGDKSPHPTTIKTPMMYGKKPPSKKKTRGQKADAARKTAEAKAVIKFNNTLRGKKAIGISPSNKNIPKSMSKGRTYKGK